MNKLRERVKHPTYAFEDILSGAVHIEKPAFSLDVENLSLKENGVLLEVGLVFFDLADAASIGKFPMVNVFLDSTEQILLGGHVDPETLEFWNQPRIKKALAWQQDRANVRRGLSDALGEVAGFVDGILQALKEVGQTEVYWIARGEKDYPQLEHWMRKVGLEPICKYNKVQDVRSMIAAYLDKPQGYSDNKDYPKELGEIIRHTAIGDAVMDAYDLALVRQQCGLVPDPVATVKEIQKEFLESTESSLRERGLRSIERNFRPPMGFQLFTEGLETLIIELRRGTLALTKLKPIFDNVDTCLSDWSLTARNSIITALGGTDNDTLTLERFPQSADTIIGLMGGCGTLENIPVDPSKNASQFRTREDLHDWHLDWASFDPVKFAASLTPNGSALKK